MNAIDTVLIIAIPLLIIEGQWFRDTSYLPKRDLRLVWVARILLVGVMVFTFFMGREG